MTEVKSIAFVPRPAEDFAFPARIIDLMPKMSDIPKEFTRVNGTPWNKIASDFFFFGAKRVQWNAKRGIDKDAAIRHIRSILWSFEPSHGHKEAACAYLMSLWFDSITYERGNK